MLRHGCPQLAHLWPLWNTPARTHARPHPRPPTLTSAHTPAPTLTPADQQIPSLEDPLLWHNKELQVMGASL
jgi:hypothetical protein